jgi:hypothetical protein
MKRTAFILIVLFTISALGYGQTLQKGDFTASVNTEGWSLAAGSGDRTQIEFITFDKPFDTPPTVMVSLTGCDATADAGGSVRVQLTVDKITKVGCIIKVKTWGNSKVGAVWGNWLAFSK